MSREPEQPSLFEEPIFPPQEALHELTIEAYVSRTPQLQKIIRLLHLPGFTQEQLKAQIQEWNSAHSALETGNGSTAQEHRSDSGLVLIIKMDSKGNVRLDGGWQVKG